MRSANYYLLLNHISMLLYIWKDPSYLHLFSWERMFMKYFSIGKKNTFMKRLPINMKRYHLDVDIFLGQS